MDATLRSQTAFHLTGRSPGGPLEAIAGLGLRPALLARYRELARLRHDFPLVLVEPAPGGAFVRSLSGIVNELACEAAPVGPAGEVLRKRLLHIERDIRRTAAEGGSGLLSELWQQGVDRLAGDHDESSRQLLALTSRLIPVDGQVVDCDENLVREFFTHAWQVVQKEKLGRVREDINGLIVRLNDILRADFVGSGAGRQPESLRASVGTGQQGLFDFEIMARLLAGDAADSRLNEARRGRIEWALSVLRSQRFFAAPMDAGPAPYEFDFDSCRAVQETFRERLPEMAQLVKAMSLAELEGDGRYVESRHDDYFESFGESSLSPGDLEMFPDYFVWLRGRPADTTADAGLMQLLSSGIPVKVLVEVDDLLEESSVGQRTPVFGVRSTQLASLAVGLNDAFVLQTTNSHLLPMQASIRRGLSVAAPAIFCIYTAAAPRSEEMPRYLLSAAAMQSRAFPAFSFDPTAGEDLASQFSLEGNPQPDRDWAVAKFEFADEALQRVCEELPFTFADFVLADPRYAEYFARISHGAWNTHMVPVSEWLGGSAAAANGQVPCLMAVDRDDLVQRLIVDDRLVQAARRCLEQWHRLQELGGIRNSHAERLLARERAAWEESGRQAAATMVAMTESSPEPEASQTPAAPVAEPAAVPEEEAARSPDEAWIETIRCSSCNECTQINGRMFAYDDNQQAYIKDLAAGSYRELIEAAESCQLAIIHPGKPFDPQEAGLQELIERARPFL
jgi:ferredoxin